MMRKNKLVLCAVISVLLLVLILVLCFWDTIALYFMPKTVLTQAASRLYDQLEERFSPSPVTLFLKTYDPEGRYTGQLQVESHNLLLGDIRYDMTVQTDSLSHRLCAQGTASTRNNDLDLSLYMDDTFLAVSSEDLVGGAWYGITYESFVTDIRSIPLLQYVISDSVVQGWDNSLRSIRSQMLMAGIGPDISLISGEDSQLFLMGLLLLPARVSRDQIRLDDMWTDCFRVDYTAGSEQLEKLLPEKDASVSVSFYLVSNSIVQIDFYYAEGANRTNGELYFGTSPVSDPISLHLKQQGDHYSETSLAIQTEGGEDRYAESWTMESDGHSMQIDYIWEPLSGSVNLSINGTEPVFFVMYETESGLFFQTEDGSALLKALNPTGTPPALKRCTVTFQKGSALTAPEYKNLDQWSLDDFWTLLRGIGVLFGIGAE